MKRFIILITSVILLCGMAVGVNAAGKSFTDVKEGAWYYDAVMSTVEKEIFSGISEDRFAPNDGMTRAMFVTALAKVMGEDVGEYTGTPFTDVKANAWYAPYVQWAYEKGITSGVSNVRFGVNDYISREQIVTLFYNAAVKYGYDTEITDTFRFSRISDITKVESWAREAMKWAMQNSIISGTGTKGRMILVSPDNTATRAQTAQIITTFLAYTEKDLAPVTGLTFNGNPIESYTIVYRDGNKICKEAAEKMQEYISEACGVTLDITTDSAEPEGPEILVGHTNRENFGVKYYHDGEDICSFEITVQDDFVTVAGKDDNYEGSLYGAFWFAKEILGMGFFTDDITDIPISRDKAVENGYIYRDGPLYEYRQVYWSGYPSELGTGSPFHGTGTVHNIEEFTGGLGRSTGDDACLTDPVLIENAKNKVISTLTKKPDLDTMWLSMNDTDSCCMCAECQKVYREEGSRFGTWARFLNIMAEAAEPINDHVDFWTLAYQYCTAPCTTVLDENIVVYYCTIKNCASHTYNDPSCPLNRSIYNHMTGWNKVCSKMYVWDYSTNFSFTLSAFPINTAIRENKSWFYDLGVRGEFNNAITGRSGEFGPLKAYLICELYWDPKMPEDEYNAKIDRFLEAYYGAGWKYIREYIDLTEELSDENHFSYYAFPRSILRDDQVMEYSDRFDALWDKAEALASSEEELNRIQTSRLSWRFMKLNGSYVSRYVEGDPASRTAYMDENTSLYSDAVKEGVRWTEKGINVAFNAEYPPYYWIS